MKYTMIVLCLLLAGCGRGFHVKHYPQPPVAGPPGPPGPTGPTGPSGPTLDFYDPHYDGNTAALVCGERPFNSTPLALGSILQQDGWNNSNNSPSIFNEAVTNVGSDACRGTGVWKVNNDIWQNAFGNMPTSPAMSESAGESSVRSAGGGDTMEMSVFFKTVSPTADGSILEIDFANATASDRMNAMRIVNSADPNGLYIQAYGYSTLPSYKFGIARNTWQHLRVLFISRYGIDETNGPDYNNGGVENDIVRIYLNGQLVVETTSFDGGYCNPGNCGSNRTFAVNRMMFRPFRASTAIDPSFTSPQGFMFDDFTTKIYNRLNPTDIKAMYRTGFEQ